MMLWPASMISVPAFSSVWPLSNARLAPASMVEVPFSKVVPVPNSRSMPTLKNSRPLASTSVPVPPIVPPLCRNFVSSEPNESPSISPLPEISIIPPFATLPADALIPLTISCPALMSSVAPFAAVSTPDEVPPPLRFRMPLPALTVPVLTRLTPIVLTPVPPDLIKVPALTKLSVPALVTMP